MICSLTVISASLVMISVNRGFISVVNARELIDREFYPKESWKGRLPGSTSLPQTILPSSAHTGS